MLIKIHPMCRVRSLDVLLDSSIKQVSQKPPKQEVKKSGTFPRFSNLIGRMEKAGRVVGLTTSSRTLNPFCS